MINLKSKAGIALPMVMSLMAVTAIVVGSFIGIARTSAVSTRRWRESDQLMFTAQSALEKAKYDIYTNFYKYYVYNVKSWQSFNWFSTYTTNSIGVTYVYNAPQGVTYSNSIVTISIGSISNAGLIIRDVVLTARARSTSSDAIERQVSETVRYEMAPGRVFDYGYFINNFGWLWGSTIYANGDARANGNFSLQYGPTVNGDIYAAVNSALGAAGTVSGTWNYWNLSTYYSTASDSTRPGNPPSSSYTDVWPQGYDGTAAEFESLTPLEMPYLGDMTDYETLATTEGGTITQNGSTLVDAVYSGNGPDGLSGTVDDGVLVLDGSVYPIIIDGPVVVDKDVIIKGEVSGQGTIYAGRNIHIAGDIVYDDGPTWTKPDYNPEATAEANKDTDALGLAAKGNIIIGDYTQSSWRSAVLNYIKPPFTQSYTTDVSDAAIGYDSDNNSGNGYVFNGNYTTNDGGQRFTDTGGVTNRKYYEASISYTNFTQIAKNETVDHIDAILYDNHLIVGKIGATTFNGAIVSRDEALIFSGSININWDIRAGSESKDGIDFDMYLPYAISDPWTTFWKELP